MESDGAIIAALNDVRAEFPAMRVRTEHVQLDGELTVFRATITLPSGAEATGYGSVTGMGVTAIARAEGRALLRAMTLLGVDQDAYDLRDGAGDDREPDEREDDDPYVGTDRYRAVADEGPADPFNLGASPSAAAVASATGMRLGARPAAAPDDVPPGVGQPAPPAARPGASSESRPARADAAAREPQAPPAAPATSASAAPAVVAPGPAAGSQTDADEDAGVSHQAFWRWASDRGLSNRADVEDLLGQSIGGMRPAAVRDLIVAAQEGDPADG